MATDFDSPYFDDAIITSAFFWNWNNHLFFEFSHFDLGRSFSSNSFSDCFLPWLGCSCMCSVCLRCEMFWTDWVSKSTCRIANLYTDSCLQDPSSLNWINHQSGNQSFHDNDSSHFMVWKIRSWDSMPSACYCSTTTPPSSLGSYTFIQNSYSWFKKKTCVVFYIKYIFIIFNLSLI